MTTTQTERTMAARFGGTCTVCGAPIAVGEQMIWSPQRRRARHPACLPTPSLRDRIYAAVLAAGVTDVPAASFRSSRAAILTADVYERHALRGGLREYDMTDEQIASAVAEERAAAGF